MNHDQKTPSTVLEAAAAKGQITPEAAKNIRDWLAEPRYAGYRPQLVEHLRQGKFAELNDAFWNVIPFGTGGRRGKMYPIGSAVMNERTVGESAQGLADYFRGRSAKGGTLACAIAHDTRHRSPEFAKLSAEIMAAAGYTVYFLEGFRSTPELSFATRFKQCICGIMITASHNPPSDNGFKAYGPTGGQLVPPDDKGVIERVMAVDVIARLKFDEGVAAGKIVLCQDEVDAAFQAAVLAQSLPGPRNVKLIYSPLHGVGSSAVLPVLRAAGFENVEEFQPHAAPDGDFPNVAGHVSNPENPGVFDPIIARAKQTGADLVLATDPDCDRLGCAAPLKAVASATWETLTGNQIGSLLCDFVLESRQRAGTLSPRHYVVKTLVTTELIRRIAESYSVRCVGDLQVGFKWIGQTMDEQGPAEFVLGLEESHGYLVGQYARDKDAVVATMLLSELAASAKAAGQTLHERLDSLFVRFGCHQEQTISLTMPGQQGMADMQRLMSRLREAPPEVLADLRVVGLRDYLNLTQSTPVPSREGQGKASREVQPLAGPRGDMVILDLSSEGNYVAIRPSGTEPKVKLYMFTYHPPQDGTDLAETNRLLIERMAALEHDLRRYSSDH
ncbi:MAG: phospho-sugar mutase [Planctomycetia bacterium]|nr:phospho-sugar mutase [Planctomycetia bacterium]